MVPRGGKGLAFFVLVLALALSVCRGGRAGEPTVRLGVIDLSFYAVVGVVVEDVLEELGHDVDVRYGTHGEIFPLLGAGEVDLLVAAWLPDAHRPLWEKVRDRVFEAATLYEGARLYWAVPAYVPANLVSTIDDLRKPDVLERMDRRIVGIGPTSGLMQGALRIVGDYGLAEAGYRVVPGTAAEWIANLRTAVAEERWVVVPLWRPHFLNAAYDLRILGEPKGIYGPGDRAVLLAHEGLAVKVPARTLSVLRNLHLGLDAVTRMDYLVNVEGLSPREAARAWMRENERTVRSWMEAP